MQKSPYWMMIGAVAGFLIGVAAIMLATADYTIDNVFCQPLDGATFLSMPIRVIVIITGMAVGMVTGLLATLILSKISPDAELPVP